MVLQFSKLINAMRYNLFNKRYTLFIAMCETIKCFNFRFFHIHDREILSTICTNKNKLHLFLDIESRQFQHYSR